MNIGNRMKEYEEVWDQRLPRKLPVIIRLDGNSFSQWTKKAGLKKPFDKRLALAMSVVCQSLAKYCSGPVIAYTQSDEISLLLRNDQTPQTEAFLGNRVQKLCSLLASLATVSLANTKLGQASDSPPAMFDCRVFALPNKQEVNNYFLWRQLDAFKNCVSSYCYHSGVPGVRKAVHGLSTKERQEWLFKNCGVNIDKVPTWQKRGFCVRKHKQLLPLKQAVDFATLKKAIKNGQDPERLVERTKWKADWEIPEFNKETSYVYSGGKNNRTGSIIPT